MLLEISAFGLYLLGIHSVTRTTSSKGKLQIFAAVISILLSERLLSQFDPTSPHHELSIQRFVSPNMTLYVLMAMCFLLTWSLYCGGKIERWLVWTVVSSHESHDDSESYRGRDVDEYDPLLKWKLQQDHLKRQRQSFLEYFERSDCLQVVREEDVKTFGDQGFIMDANMTDAENEPGVTKSLTSRRTEAHLCPICLETFEKGDRFVWSSNLECSHIFHVSCLIEFLARFDGDGKASCPCCRRPYCAEIQTRLLESKMKLECR